MVKATATNTAASANGFTAQPAAWTFGMGTPEFHARRKHWGPPAGLADRREAMYSGRKDHLHQWEPPRGWNSAKKPTAEALASAGINGKAHMATMDNGAQLAEAERAEKFNAFVRGLAQLLEIPLDPHAAKEPEPERRINGDRRENGDHERRNNGAHPKSEKNANQSEFQRKRALRAHYDRLDQEIKEAGGPLAITPEWFQFTDASDAYQRIFFNGIRHGMPAYAAHNWATRKTEGKQSANLI